ncbi:MAG: hypothetical protein J5800_08930, partial [Spirochaetales bacterium]|nr:hypothetical protein [Spirochaetales bacterium]
MFKRTAIDLGLDLVLGTVSGHALSSIGSDSVKNANPIFDRDAYLLRQKQVAAVMYAITKASSENGMRVESFPDISGALEFMVARPTASLEGEQIFNIGLFIRSARLLRSLLSLSTQLGCPDSDSGVQDLIAEIPESLLYLEQEIFRILDSPGVVKENYPTVKALRDKADGKRRDRSRLASELMRQNANIMQSDAAVMRDGRILLPVRNES